MNKIKDRIKESAESISGWGLGITTLSAYILAGGLLLEGITFPFRALAAVPANLAVAGVQAIVESAQDNNVEQYNGSVKNIGYSRLMQTKGVLYWADVETTDGDMRRIYDTPRVLKGKIANTIVPSSQDLEDRLAWYQRSPVSIEAMFTGGSDKGLEVGRNYKFSVVGSTLLKAEEI